MDFKSAAKTVEKFTLAQPISIEELHALMTQRWGEGLPGGFKLKKGLMGPSIGFDTYMQTAPKVTVKDNVVTVRRIGKSTQVGGVDFKDSLQRSKALKDGGIQAAAFGGQEYFLGVCDRMREVLADRLA